MYNCRLQCCATEFIVAFIILYQQNLNPIYITEEVEVLLHLTLVPKGLVPICGIHQKVCVVGYLSSLPTASTVYCDGAELE